MDKEFVKKWKQGIEKVSALKQINIQIFSSWMIIIGIISGIIASILNIKNFWWVIIILAWALINSFIQLWGLWQKKKILENIERRFTNE